MSKGTRSKYCQVASSHRSPSGDLAPRRQSTPTAQPPAPREELSTVRAATLLSSRGAGLPQATLFFLRTLRPCKSRLGCPPSSPRGSQPDPGSRGCCAPAGPDQPRARRPRLPSSGRGGRTPSGTRAAGAERSVCVHCWAGGGRDSHINFSKSFGTVSESLAPSESNLLSQ